jgi:uncharacterized protein YndB with AHSA1/START domain
MDTTTSHSVLPIELHRTIPAPPERVFRAWTDPAALSRWFSPSEEFTVIVHEADARVGGRYRIEMRHQSGRQHIAVGVYREVTPPKRLVFTWAWEGEDTRPETVVSVDLRSSSGGTDLVLTHRGFSDEKDRDDHGGGWTGALVLLAKKI